jgi:glycosyltransferase involved in cell wall biosynthesis
MKSDMSSPRNPLVTVGIPTYNRPEGLRKTLDCITRQTYGNLEIIVSDNCSQKPEVSAVVHDAMKTDPRIKFTIQERNMGALHNFKYVLEAATGDYFMWAADDDEWEPFFIETCFHELACGDGTLAAVMMEAQYYSDKGIYPFFREGVPFYDSTIVNIRERLDHMLVYNYGNLFYSLFRRDALFHDSVSLFSLYNLVSLNEIPLFLFVLLKGHWRVLPQIGFRKKTNDSVYAQARWEKEGGRLPNSGGLAYFRTLPYIYRYHRLALQDIIQVINLLDIDDASKSALRSKTKQLLHHHFMHFITRRKPRLFNYA